MNSVSLPTMFGGSWLVFGGPYLQRPHYMLGVKLARELDRQCDLSLDIHDFSVPDVTQAVEVITAMTHHIVNGTPVYVGCMAGRGRTGLVLALLAKLWGIKNPVEYVRKTYHPHAVETKAQYQFVTSFEFPAKLRGLVWLCRVIYSFIPQKTLTVLD